MQKNIWGDMGRRWAEMGIYRAEWGWMGMGKTREWKGGVKTVLRLQKPKKRR